jgi:hypothetical protein
VGRCPCGVCMSVHAPPDRLPARAARDSPAPDAMYYSTVPDGSRASWRLVWPCRAQCARVAASRRSVGSDRVPVVLADKYLRPALGGSLRDEHTRASDPSSPHEIGHARPSIIIDARGIGRSMAVRRCARRTSHAAVAAHSSLLPLHTHAMFIIRLLVAPARISPNLLLRTRWDAHIARMAHSG